MSCCIWTSRKAFQGSLKWPAVCPLFLHSLWVSLYPCIHSPAAHLQVCPPSLLSNLSAHSNSFLSCSSRSTGLLSLSLLLCPLHFLELHQPVWLSMLRSWCVLLFAICPSFALCSWWRRNRCCVLGGVTLGRRINVMFRSKRIVHHPVLLPGCSSSFSSLRCPSLWVGPLASKKK